jgi:uncharacterized protein YxjI
MLYYFSSLLLVSALGSLSVLQGSLLAQDLTTAMEVSQAPLELYVDWHGTQFTDIDGQTVYKVKPLPKVPIFSTDFNIHDASNQIVARVRERVISAKYKWIIEYRENGVWHKSVISFPFFRYLASIKVRGRNFKLHGDFPRHQYDIVGAKDKITYAESELQSKIRMGYGMASDLYKLTIHPELPAPLVVALHRIGYLWKSGNSANVNRAKAYSAIAGALAASNQQYGDTY